MSPGLAKRVHLVDEESLDSFHAYNTSDRKLSKSLVTSTCSSTSSSTNATITPASSSTTSSSTTNSIHTASQMNQTNAHTKIQNALERNMKKLNISAGQSGQMSAKQKNGTRVNLTQEEMELFANNGVTLKVPGQQQSGFSADSLGSTPEHSLKQNQVNKMDQGL